MESEASCRSTAASEDEVDRCEEDSDRYNDDCCCCCSCASCPPHLFTSILLGLLACVLVSGGVFLAFHKWDHTWLLVSAVGVILMIIGTALHCCSASPRDRKSHRCKGGCGSGAVRTSKPDPLSNGGVLSEQLLPLSNARSVSQLSLNMVPGYFPPIVYPSASTPYGLEQHSAVVQNVSRLVQHQQQLHLQAPTSTADGTRSFILVPLPADTSAANIQNIVNAVCQLDANTSQENGQNTESGTVPSPSTQNEDSHITAAPDETTDAHRPLAATAEGTQSTVTVQPVRKNAEVQTCNEWQNAPELKTRIQNNNRNALESSNVRSAECNTTESSCQAVETELLRADDSCIVYVNDCAPTQTQELISTTGAPQESGNPICDTQEPSTQINITLSTTMDEQVRNENTTAQSTSVNEISNSDFTHSDIVSSCAIGDGQVNSADVPSTDEVIVESVADALERRTTESTGETTDSSEQAMTASDVPSSDSVGLSSNFEEHSESSSDIEEDSELLGRSSPPPSYEDVTQEGQSAPALGGLALAYGTM